MKKFLLSALALTMVTGPMLAAPASAQMDRHDDRGPQGDHRDDRGPHGMGGPGDHRGGPGFRNDWHKGERFDRSRAQNYREIDYRRYRGLRAPPRGYRYYQSGNDAVLVGITSGIIGGVIAGAIR